MDWSQRTEARRSRSPVFAAPALLALNYAEMRARCWRRLTLRRAELWHGLRIALVIEALLRKVDGNAPRKRA
jgi:hypothetical protein